MLAVDYLEKIIRENFGVGGFEGLVKKHGRVKNLAYFFIRLFTSQKFRLNVGAYRKIFKEVFYYSKKFSLDYINYIYKTDPKIPLNFFSDKDRKEILYFLKIYFLLAFKESLAEIDFEGRWKKFEKIRKEVGENLRFNILRNIYTLYGFKSIVYPDTGVFPDYFKIKDWFKKDKFQVIFDLGAFNGDTAYAFSKLKKIKTIYAFEPDPDNFAILKENIKLNNLQDVVVPVEVGVGLREGYFYLEKAGESSSILSSKSKGTVKVKVTTIDNFVAKNNIKKVDFIKMDIEGAEFDALKGAVLTLKRDKPDLLIAIYHKGEHFFEIPGWLKKQVPEYNLRFVAMNAASPIIERYIAASVRRI